MQVKLKQSEKQLTQPKTKREATQKKVVKLNKTIKGIAANIHDKTQRRQYLNMQLDAERSKLEYNQKRRRGREDSRED